MEEAKAAAYYDELTRKGTGAARFKQGLGFSSSSDDPPKPGEALPSTSSFYSSFVRASANPSELSDYERRSRLESVRDKLRKKDRSPSPDLSLRERRRRSRSRSIERKRRRSRSRSSERRRRSRSRSIDRKRRRSRSSSSERGRRSRSRSRERRKSRSRSGERKRRRSRSRSGERKRRRSRSRSGGRNRRRRRSRSRSWERGRRGIGRDNGRRSRSPRRKKREEKSDGGKDVKGSAPDYSRLIVGYSEMSSAERVKAKMKLQLKETAKKDVMKGSNSKWERFNFDKDAPLDDEEIDAAEDDSSLVKDIGQTFRFAAVKAKREDEIKAAHDQAMFGAPAAPLSQAEETADDNEKRESNEDLVKRSTLISDNLVSAMQQGSWRDRVRRAKEAS